METESVKTINISEIIRAAMKSTGAKSSTGSKTKPAQAAKGVQRSKHQPRLDEHGERGDFSRSNSNPTSQPFSNSAPVGLEDVSGDGDGSLLAVIRIAINNTGNAPSKRAAKRAASPKMTRSDRVFAAGKGCGPGSSKSPTLDAIKAIAATETGCIVTTKKISLSESQKNANTTQGNYVPMIVE